MPTISFFYGIAIQMFWNDHAPPHFHARYGASRAIFRISDCVLIGGELPPTATNIVRDWALAHQTELEHNWQMGISGQPMDKIAGPDD
ncbi:MAG: DUF4160 domain-containing protein [Mesorhizobium sp.]|nr:DUF4160 domain-containing protein [Mesorhizobium sp.]